MSSSGGSWSGAAVPGDRVQAILRYIDRLKQGDLDAELGAPGAGAVDLRRAEEMMQALLDAVTRSQCRAVIIDLTGVESIDAALGGLLLSLVRAVELLGARGIIVGIRPEVARGLLADGVDISRVATLSRLRDALVLCMGQAQGRPALRSSLR